MKDLSMRIWNSHDKCMEYIDDLYFFEEQGIHKSGDGGHFGEYPDPVMIASPFYDAENNRLYENDIIIVHWSNWDAISIIEFDEYRGWAAHEVTEGNSNGMRRIQNVKYEKIGDTYSNPEIVETAKQEYNEKEELRRRERELKCLEKLKAKYEGEVK